MDFAARIDCYSRLFDVTAQRGEDPCTAVKRLNLSAEEVYNSGNRSNVLTVIDINRKIELIQRNYRIHLKNIKMEQQRNVVSPFAIVMKLNYTAEALRNPSRTSMILPLIMENKELKASEKIQNNYRIHLKNEKVKKDHELKSKRLQQRRKISPASVMCVMNSHMARAGSVSLCGDNGPRVFSRNPSARIGKPCVYHLVGKWLEAVNKPRNGCTRFRCGFTHANMQNFNVESRLYFCTLAISELSNRNFQTFSSSSIGRRFSNVKSYLGV